MAKSHDDVILDALRNAMAALPALLPLSGTKALFSGKQVAIAHRAVAEGLLTIHQTQVKSGKKTKTVDVAVLTEAGARKLSSATGSQNLKGVLEAIQSAVEKLGKPTSPPDPVEFRNTVEKAAATCVSAINTAFSELREKVIQAVTPSGGPKIDPAPVFAALTTALGKVEPTVERVAVVVGSERGVPALPMSDPVKDIANEIVSFVNTTARERTVGCDFVELFDHLRSKHRNLSIGVFQDALRSLDTAGRIRLKDWPGMQDDMPRPELAFFVSHTVMYHVQPAR